MRENSHNARSTSDLGGNYPNVRRNATNSFVGKGSSLSRCRRCISITLVECFYVIVRLPINPSLAKLAKQIDRRLAALASDLYYLHPFLLARKDDLCNTYTCDQRPRLAGEGHLVHPSILIIVKNSCLCSAKTQHKFLYR